MCVFFFFISMRKWSILYTAIGPAISVLPSSSRLKTTQNVPFHIYQLNTQKKAETKLQIATKTATAIAVALAACTQQSTI